MSTAIISIKIDKQTKAEAQKVAEDLGFSLSAVIKAQLKHLIRFKSINVSLEEEPSEYLLESLKKSDEDFKKGNYSPTFSNAEDAVAWLDNG